MKDLFEEFETKLEIKEQDAVVLRPYQTDSVESVFEEFETKQSTLVCLPTGCGKSVVFSAILKRFHEANPTARMLVLAHRSELISQAAGHAMAAGLTCGIEKAGQTAERQAVIVSTVQTQNASSRCGQCLGDGCDHCDGIGKVKRMEKFDPTKFSLLVIDEAHHATADSYRNILTYYRQNPNLKILMVTATPTRADKVGLHNVCDSVAYEMQLKEAIDAGWLVPIRQKFIQVRGLDLSKVKTAMGDLQAKGIERAFIGLDQDTEKLLHEVAGPTLEIAAGKQVLVFSAGQEHAKLLTAAFTSYDVDADYVIDSTKPAERAKIVKRFRDGELQVLVNCMCFTEGFDAPATAVVANCRPTKSETLLLQMIGRGTRTLKGTVDGLDTPEERKAAIAGSDKPECVVLDFIGASQNVKVTTVFDLLAGDDCDPIDLKAALKIAETETEPVDVEALIEKMKAAREKEDQERGRLSTTHTAENIQYGATDVDLFGANRRYAKTIKDPGAVAAQFNLGPASRYKGTPIANIPIDHLDWVSNCTTERRVIAAIKLYKARLKGGK